MVRRASSSAPSHKGPDSGTAAVAARKSAGPEKIAHPFSLTGLQRKVKVGSSGDAAEHEANRVAEQVTSGPSSAKPAISRLETMQRKSLETPSGPEHAAQKKEESAAPAQRASCGECEAGQPEQPPPPERASGTASVYCKLHHQTPSCAENELNHSVRRKGGPAGAPSGDMDAAATHAVATKDAGAPLRPHVLQRLESRMGVDLSGVRVHEGPAAQESAAALQARAFTHQGDIWLGKGESQENTNLMAHEATHVVQQGAAVRRSADVPKRRDEEQTGSPAVRRSVWDKLTGAAGAVWDATGGRVVDAAGNVIAAGADLFWQLVKSVAPAWIVDLIQAIREKGIFGYLKDKLSGAFKGIFGGLSNGGGFIPGLIQTFSKLSGTAHELIGALGRGDCKPLFDAVSRLGDVLGQMAGEAWDKIKAFFAPVGDFFSDLWKKFGAPAIDFLTQYASDLWTEIKGIGQKLWDGTQPVRDAAAAAWKWVKDQLGIGDGPEGQNGLLQWVQGKLSDAWDWIKQQLQPVIGPMQAFYEKIKAILPLDAILHLREKVHEWLQHTAQMATAMRNPKGVTQNQDALRGQILPAVKAAIVGLGSKIASAGGWVSAQIGGIAQTVTGFFASLRSNPILSAFSGAIHWVQDKVAALATWVEGGVMGLFSTIGSGVAKLADFVEPVLNALNKVVTVLANIVKELPGLVLGPIWKAIPACIRDPIKDFIIQNILNQIPVISTFLKVPEIWGKIKQLVMGLLSDVFVNGDLAGAVLRVFRFVLEAAGVDYDLMLSVLAKAASSLDEIIMHPVKFLGNLAGAVGQGLKKFVLNLPLHLATGLVNWLVKPLKDLGVEPIKDLSLTSILTLVMSVLGITEAKLRAKAEKAVGPKALQVLEAAWKWIKALLTKGLGGIWDEIKNQLSNLYSSVIGGISKWITTEIVEAGVAKLIKLSNPAGAIIEAIQTIYKTLSFLAEKANEILALVDSVLNSIQKIVAGDIASAAGWIENALARAVPAVIAFLAKWLGFSDPGPKVHEIVKGIQDQVEGALDWLVDKAIAIGKKVMDALGLSKKEDKPDEIEGDYIYEAPDTGGHILKIRKDLKVFRFSNNPTPVSGAIAQKVEQDALEKIVPRIPVNYPESMSRAAGPSGHITDVKEGEEREDLPSLGALSKGVPAYLRAYQPGDHRGHLVGDRFNGSPIRANLVPMHQQLNLSTFKRFENSCASEFRALKSADKAVLLYMKIVPSYPKDDPNDPASFRPTSVTAEGKTITLQPGPKPQSVEKAVPGGGTFSNPDTGFVKPAMVNLSTGAKDEIAALPGITPAVADQIVTGRSKQNTGVYWEYADLLKTVPQLKVETLQELQNDHLVRIR